MRLHRALAPCLTLGSLLALPACVSKAVCEDVAPEAMRWATEDRLAVTFQAPEALGSVRFVRRSDTATVGTAAVWLRAPRDPVYESMLREVHEDPLRGGPLPWEPLSPGAEVVAACELEPPARLGQEGEWEASALLVVEEDGRPLVLARGPLGWTRASVQDYERREPSVAKAVLAGGGVSLLVVGGLATDAVIGAGIAAAFLGYVWILAGCPGLPCR